MYPILTYSADIWGFENKNIIEKIHLKFRKKISGVKTSTPNLMVYGEPGRYPMELQIKCCVFGTKLWVTLISYLVKSTDYYLNCL